MADSSKFEKLKTNIQSAVDKDTTGSLKNISNRLGDNMVTISTARLLKLAALKTFKTLLKENFIDFPGATVLSTSKSILDGIQSPMIRLGVDETNPESVKLNSALKKARSALSFGDDKSKTDSAKDESTTEGVKREEDENNRLKEFGEFLQSL